MNQQEVMAFTALRDSRSPEEIKAFSAALMADHDSIIRYDILRDSIDRMPKEERKAIYKRLNAETAKYPGMVQLEDPLLGKPMAALRSKIGLFRGVKWDRNGKLRVSDKVHQENIALFQSMILEIAGKDADQKKDYGPKVAHLRELIAHHQEMLDGTKKTNGSIWDFITEEK